MQHWCNGSTLAFQANSDSSSLLCCSNNIGVWCNGNTQDFDSCFVGSNPTTPAKHLLQKEKTTMRELIIRNRIALLQSRKTENGNIINKLKRKLKRITEQND